MVKTIVGVNYKSKYTGEFGGKTYNYFCEIEANVGDIVNVPTANGDSVARICEVDVPDSRIDERIMPIMKTITAFAEEQEG